MNNLSKFNIKCLANMPMMLHSISATTDVLRIILKNQHVEMRDYLGAVCSQIKYTITNDEELISTFDLENDVLTPNIEFMYSLLITQNKKPYCALKVEFGYICDETQNVIYFQIFDESDKHKIVSVELIESMRQGMPNAWRTGVLDDNSIYIEFDVDETMSIEKIEQCYSDFKTYILERVIAEIKK